MAVRDTAGGVTTPAVGTPLHPAGRDRGMLRDTAFVASVIAASAALYVTRLGFASDDWAFLGSLTTHGDLSAPGRSVEHDFAIYLRPRPVQVTYQTLLYDAFGPNPLGYHLVEHGGSRRDGRSRLPRA